MTTKPAPDGLAEFIRHVWRDADGVDFGWHLDVMAEHMEAVAAGKAPRWLIAPARFGNIPVYSNRFIPPCPDCGGEQVVAISDNDAAAGCLECSGVRTCNKEG